MNKLFLRLAISLAALVPVSSALAADLDPPPPPVEELRPSSYDWSGVHVGVFAGGTYMEGHYDTTEFCSVALPVACGGYDPEMSGIGLHGGFLVGYNHQFDNAVIGVEADWAFGGEIGSNEEPAEMTYMDFDSIATLRARAGMAFDNTLIYATAGVALIDSRFYSTDAPMGSGLEVEDSKWLTGLAIGAGVEHAFTDHLSGKMEYMYIGAPTTTYELSNASVAGEVKQDFESIHMIRAGLNYNFSL
jgi:outer membrane immunogenic protein